ncbi:MAG: nitroreductase family protein [Candidatus Kapabacteria bacterium]|nr:nitroreductase family protein [Candidatus Kapabacteria bacterium]
MLEKKALTKVEINDVLARRWSIRAFDPNKEVEKEKIIAICEAARWSPSSAGDEPWNFILFDRFKDPESFAKALDCLSDYNQIWVKYAPLLILTIARDKWRNSEDLNRWSQHDTGAAAMSIYIQAVSMGLMAHPMGGFSVEKVIDEFEIPDGFTPMAMIAIGYQGDLEILDDYNKKRETAPRKRRDLSDNFYYGKWGKAIEF